MQAYVEVIFERPLYVHVGLGTPTHYSFRVAQTHNVVVLRLCVRVCVCVCDKLRDVARRCLCIRNRLIGAD